MGDKWRLQILRNVYMKRGRSAMRSYEGEAVRLEIEGAGKHKMGIA
jgi:hypothetical protein